MSKNTPLIEDLNDLAGKLSEIHGDVQAVMSKIFTVQTHEDLVRLKHIESVVKVVLETATMKSASFSRSALSYKEDPLPKSEKEVDEFIKRRVRLWLETWICGPLQSVLSGKEKDWL